MTGHVRRFIWKRIAVLLSNWKGKVVVTLYASSISLFFMRNVFLMVIFRCTGNPGVSVWSHLLSEWLKVKTVRGNIEKNHGSEVVQKRQAQVAPRTLRSQFRVQWMLQRQLWGRLRRCVSSRYKEIVTNLSRPRLTSGVVLEMLKLVGEVGLAA